MSTSPLPHASISSTELRQYLPLVHQVVARFIGRLPPNVLRDDLVAAGTFGLIDSLRRDGERGPAFEWYARIRIRGAVVDELRTQDWLSRRARSRVTAQQKDEAVPASMRAAVVGFDDLPGGVHSPFVPQANDQSPAEIVEQGEESAAMSVAIAALPERERMIISLHYFHQVQFKEIAARLGVSEPRISQLHSRALGMLRTALESREAA